MLNKGILITVLTLIVVILAISPSFAEEYVYDYYKSVKLIIGQKEAEVNFEPITMDQPAYVNGGRTLVPFRFLGESLGAQISWDNKKNQATLKLGTTEVKVTIGSKAAYVNGRLQSLDVAAELKGGRTFIPLRFVSESLGAYVTYFDAEKKVSVTYADMTGWKDYTAPLNELKYKYPLDWKVSTEQDDVFVRFTSPRDSNLWVQWASDKPEEARKFFKQRAEELGWKLISDELKNPNNPNEGSTIDYEKFDSVLNAKFRYVIYISSLNEGSFIQEQVLKDDDYFEMENVVMLNIAES